MDFQLIVLIIAIIALIFSGRDLYLTLFFIGKSDGKFWINWIFNAIISSICIFVILFIVASKLGVPSSGL